MKNDKLKEALTPTFSIINTHNKKRKIVTSFYM